MSYWYSGWYSGWHSGWHSGWYSGSLSVSLSLFLRLRANHGLVEFFRAWLLSKTTCSSVMFHWLSEIFQTFHYLPAPYWSSLMMQCCWVVEGVSCECAFLTYLRILQLLHAVPSQPDKEILERGFRADHRGEMMTRVPPRQSSSAYTYISSSL